MLHDIGVGIFPANIGTVGDNLQLIINESNAQNLTFWVDTLNRADVDAFQVLFDFIEIDSISYCNIEFFTDYLKLFFFNASISHLLLD